MGGVSGGASKSSSKPKMSEQQKATYRFMFSDIFPQARGQDTALTNIMAQNARDEGAAMQGQQMQQAQQGMAVQGGGGSQMASLLKAQQEQAMQQTFKQITQNRQATALNALSMIAGLPLTPGQESKSSSWNAGVSVGSSRRWKNNIRELKDQWRKILQLNPVKFEYKDNPGVEHIGYIAEDLDALALDHVVDYDKDGLPNAINYSKLTVYLVEMIKDQEKRIQTLEKQQDNFERGVK